MNIVTFGGGTGQSILLKSIKTLPISITAVSGCFDSGGSSGILKKKLNIVPPGDLRKCLSALSDLEDLFESRIIDNHPIGNLVLADLFTKDKNCNEALIKAKGIFKSKGNVFSVSNTPTELVATLSDGSIIEGETNIDNLGKNSDNHVTKIELKEKIEISEQVLNSLTEASHIIIGPGDHYSSITPLFLVEGIKEAIKDSDTKVIYIENLKEKKGETAHKTNEECANEILELIGRDSFDILISKNDDVTEDGESHSVEKLNKVLSKHLL